MYIAAADDAHNHIHKDPKDISHAPRYYSIFVLTPENKIVPNVKLTLLTCCDYLITLTNLTCHLIINE